MKNCEKDKKNRRRAHEQNFKNLIFSKNNSLSKESLKK